MSSQFDTNTWRLRIEMIPPAVILAGRIVVYLTLTYRCPGANGEAMLEDRTNRLNYHLLAA
ncbi:hypothetical protein GCM10011415_28440 [Salipiger pallidus]|uniref:Uncharacterized protein n=1 Tax=Salipiger pallidus TaxID=1775170 RepID=A0A8J2ZLE6_9RHOB|nr:hypothetical protein [Salipiger pallidus]GGG77844.1 hypothetical protein GCM10011415_28440 [Salipiger pallidus]